MSGSPHGIPNPLTLNHKNLCSTFIREYEWVDEKLCDTCEWKRFKVLLDKGVVDEAGHINKRTANKEVLKELLRWKP